MHMLILGTDRYFLLRENENCFSCRATDLVVRTIMDPVSVAFHTSEGLQLNIVDIKILRIIYFIFIFTPIFCEGKES